MERRAGGDALDFGPVLPWDDAEYVRVSQGPGVCSEVLKIGSQSNWIQVDDHHTQHSNGWLLGIPCTYSPNVRERF
jgi:hypothetical protein